MMTFGRLLGAAGALLFLYVLTLFVASEAGGEVAELYRPSESGQIEPVRVWVVDTNDGALIEHCLLYTSPSPRDATLSRMPSSA